MPTLFRSDDCRVVMYPNDHLPPHLHVLMRDGRDCTVDLVTLAINGRVKREKFGWRWRGLRRNRCIF